MPHECGVTKNQVRLDEYKVKNEVLSENSN